MRILISEYVLSTFQIAKENNYVDLLPEAYAITFTLASSLNLPGIETYLTISRNLPQMSWSRVIRINDLGEYYDLIKRSGEKFDWVILIAPPRELTILSKLAGEKLLGPPSFIINLLSDKYCTSIELEKCGVRTPRTLLIENSSGIDQGSLRELNPPYVVKPSSLAGSECVYIAKSINEVLKYVDLAVKCDPWGRAVVQEFVSGVHGSISVIYGKPGALIYSLNLQLITIDKDQIKYVGGVLPVRNRGIVNEARLIVDKLFECYPMLRGYIGLDIVWSNNGVFVVEANPRLTTSFIGVNEIYPYIGKLLLESVSSSKITEIGRFLGDLSEDYAYYLILNKQVSLKPTEKIMRFYNAGRFILVGRSNSREFLLNRVRELLFSKELVYNLEHVIL